MATPLAFIDTETTGLDPTRHEVWEVGLIVQQYDRHTALGDAKWAKAIWDAVMA
jgi:oligoribonuclease (3'-5' exoribonuclease)